ncbi:MAG: transcriptional regulator, partial [Muribaculaceae bacterium]|nr:transcriptional regulator [Muribaculaceae bacterium]
ETLSGRVETLEQGMSAEINSDSDILARPQLLTSEAEGRFRRAFVTLHPDFVDAIRQRGSRLTPGDELLCMLIRLGRTTDEIAASLAIARPSVNSARYRLRSKFALDRDADLDIFICSL